MLGGPAGGPAGAPSAPGAPGAPGGPAGGAASGADLRRGGEGAFYKMRLVDVLLTGVCSVHLKRISRDSRKEKLANVG